MMTTAAAPASMAAATEDVEFVDFDPDDDDAMDEDDHAGARAVHALPFPRIISGVTTAAVVRTRGRSPFVLSSTRDRFDSLSEAAGAADCGHGPQRSIEGWIVLVTGVEEDAEEDDLYNAFSEFGHVKNLHFNLERRTGYAKGYALIEYESFKEAQTAIKAMNGAKLLTKTVYVDWAFNRGPLKQLVSTGSLRSRSRTPPRRLAALTSS